MMPFTSLAVLATLTVFWVRGLDAAIAGQWRKAGILLGVCIALAVVHRLVFP